MNCKPCEKQLSVIDRNRFEKKPKYTNTLMDDLSCDLDYVQRGWLRRTALIIMTPFLIICGAVGGICDLFNMMYSDCWNYKPHKKENKTYRKSRISKP